MTKQEAEEMIAILASEFKVKRPTLVWREGMRRGWARVSSNRISMGPKSFCGDPEATVVHEMAHIIAGMRHGERCGHDQRFMYVLWNVVIAWYKDPIRYPWGKEYPRVKKFGQARIEKWLKDELSAGIPA